MKRAITKYGVENFTKEILHVFETEEEMNQKEKELVEIGPNSYNLCEGGKGGFGYINRKGFNTGHSARVSGFKNVPRKKRLEWAKRAAQTYKDRVDRGELKRVSSYGFVGKQHSSETKKNISLSHKGRHVGALNVNACRIKDGKGNIFQTMKECAIFHRISNETLRKRTKQGMFQKLN